MDSHSHALMTLSTKLPKYRVFSVNLAPSSGVVIGFPTIAEGSRSGVAPPPTSPPSQVCPWRRGGSPSGDLTAPPALSLRVGRMEVLVRPPSTGWMREEDFPSLVTPVAEEGGFTSVSLVTPFSLSITAALPKDVARASLWAHLSRTGVLAPFLPADT